MTNGDRLLFAGMGSAVALLVCLLLHDVVKVHPSASVVLGGGIGWRFAPKISRWLGMGNP
jgi:hypothetical protein